MTCVAILTDITSIGIIEELCLEKPYLDCLNSKGEIINKNGLYINQNYIEQGARGVLKDNNGKIISINTTDKNLDILYKIFNDGLSNIENSISIEVENSITFEEFKKNYFETLIAKNGSLSAALVEIYKKYFGGVNKDEKRSIKNIVENYIWPVWANEVSVNFINENFDLLEEKYFVVAPRVCANSKQLHLILSKLNKNLSIEGKSIKLKSIFNKMNLNRGKKLYIEGMSFNEYYDYKKVNGVPYIIYSHKYTNYLNEFIKIANDLNLQYSTEEEIEKAFRNKKLVEKLKKYLKKTIEKRHYDIKKAIELIVSDNVAVSKINAIDFKEQELIQNLFCPIVISTLEKVKSLENVMEVGRIRE